jgi:transcription antitermination factor NusG
VNENAEMHWYAVRVTYSRELFFKDYLDAEGIENYIPMRYEYVVRKERRLRKLVPAVHNLVFVRSTRERMDEIKNKPGMNIPIRYIMDRETRQPIVIPDSQMRSFIAVSGTYDQAVLYLEPTELNLSQGTRVRITGGIFEGVEGVFVRVRHDRRVVVNIEGVMAVATTFVHASLVEEIGEGKTYRIHGKASKN